MSAQKRLGESEVSALSRERPYALQVVQTQILYDVAGMLEEAVERLARMEELLARPKGYVYPIRLTVERLTVVDFIEAYPHTRMFSVTLYNDGPDEVYPSVNVHQKSVSLKPGESLTIDCRSPVIERLYLDVEGGRKAFVRGFGVY